MDAGGFRLPKGALAQSLRCVLKQVLALRAGQRCPRVMGTTIDANHRFDRSLLSSKPGWPSERLRRWVGALALFLVYLALIHA